MFHGCVRQPMSSRTRSQHPCNYVCFFSYPAFLWPNRAEIGVVPKGPLLRGAYREICPEGQPSFVDRERQNFIAEITDPVWSSQQRFAFAYPFRDRRFKFGGDSAAEDCRLGPPTNVLAISRQP